LKIFSRALEDNDHHIRIDAMTLLKQYAEDKFISSLSILFTVAKQVKSPARARALTLLAMSRYTKQCVLNIFYEALTDKDIAIQLAAIEGLSNRGKSISNLFTIVNKALAHRDPQIRQSAIRLLSQSSSYFKESSRVLSSIRTRFGKIRDDVATLRSLLSRALSDEDNSVRREALESIVVLRKRIHDPMSMLYPLYDNDDIKTKIKVIKCLGVVGDTSQLTIDFLLKALMNDETLIHIAAKESLQSLVKIAPNNVLLALRRLLSITYSINARISMINVLVELGDHSYVTINNLFEALKDKEYVIRKAAEKALTSITKLYPGTMLPLLYEAMNDDNSYIRTRVIILIVKSGDTSKKALAVFQNALSDKLPIIKIIAAASLEMLGKQVYLDNVLLPILRNAVYDIDPLVRRHAIYLLRKLASRNKNAIILLCQINQNSSQLLQLEEIEAWGSLLNEASDFVLPVLRHLTMSHKNSYVTRKAISVLGRSGDASNDTLTVLEKALIDRDQNIRIAAIESLSLLVSDKIIFNIFRESRYVHIRKMAVNWFANSGDRDDEMRDCLLKIFYETSSEIRIEIAEILESFGKNVFFKIIPFVRKLIRHKDSQIQLKAVSLLLKNGDFSDAIIGILCKKLIDSNSNVKKAAVAALEMLTGHTIDQTLPIILKVIDKSVSGKIAINIGILEIIANCLSLDNLIVTFRSRFSKPKIAANRNVIFQKSLFNKKTKQQQYGWNCFDVSIDLGNWLAVKVESFNNTSDAELTRHALVDLALEQTSDVTYRRLLAPEIRHAAALTAIYMNLQEAQDASTMQRSRRVAEWLSVSEALVGSNEQGDVVRKINDILSETDVSKSTLDDLREASLPENLQTDELRDLMLRYQAVHDAAEATDADITEIERELSEFCQRQDVYETYINDYYGQKGWFAFQRSVAGESGSTSMVDVTAKLLGLHIQIYQKDKLIYETEYYGGEKVRINYNGHNHFTKCAALRVESIYLSEASAMTFWSCDQRRRDSNGLTGPASPETSNFNTRLGA